MKRGFQTHRQRLVHDLDGVWEFAFLGDKAAGIMDVHSIVFDDRMMVPGCFDATPAYLGKRGLAAYRTVVTIPEAVRHELVFYAVHNWCRIHVNGQLVGEHSGGFTRFAFLLDSLVAGENEIVVVVDNRLNYATSPIHLDYFDWYQYGGITQSVELHRVGDLHIDNLVIRSEDHVGRKISVDVCYKAGAFRGPAELEISCDGHLLCREQYLISSPEGHIRKEFHLPECDLWSPENPSLHLLEARLGSDDLCERFGLRTVKIKNGKILINDAPVKLLGFNRHELHPQFGCSSPDGLFLADLQLFRQTGANFLRGSHYPQDIRLLDMCDEMGICVWQEGTSWQHKTEHLSDPFFVAKASQNLKEMVTGTINHPAIIIWGVLNEGSCHEAGARPGYETLIKVVRAADASRPVTYASCHPFTDVCRDLIDIVAINTYPGWYEGQIEQIPQWIGKIIEHIDSTGHAGKPLIISEIGASAMYGCRETHGKQWTEQYQARLLDTVIDTLFRQTNRVCGLSIWQFCDCRTGYCFLGRPRGYNNKGVLDEYRRPKMAFEVVQKKFKGLREGRSAPS